MTTLLNRILFVSLFIFSVRESLAQKLDKEKKYFLSAIGFWNVENLYDTLNDQWKNDEDFTPVGIYAWNGERYRTKIKHLSDVISQLATDATPDGLAILGLSEIENQSVVKDLVNAPKLKKRNYQVVHVEGPDARGVDVSFIYNPSYFKVQKVVSQHVTVVTDSAHKTRDILVVSGFFLAEPMAILVNHWPSRRGGEMASRPNRIEAAKVARRITDSILTVNPKTKIAIIGDLNDDPVDVSVKKHLGTFSEYNSPLEGRFFNPMDKLYLDGIGSLAWQDSWNLFDQIILNQNWLGGNFDTWQYYTARVFNKPFLKSDFGNFKGYPLRTFSGATYTAGYSDHFPVYIIIAKENK